VIFNDGATSSHDNTDAQIFHQKRDLDASGLKNGAYRQSIMELDMNSGLNNSYLAIKELLRPE
jgi:hypothetical protein